MEWQDVIRRAIAKAREERGAGSSSSDAESAREAANTSSTSAILELIRLGAEWDEYRVSLILRKYKAEAIDAEIARHRDLVAKTKPEGGISRKKEIRALNEHDANVRWLANLLAAPVCLNEREEIWKGWTRIAATTKEGSASKPLPSPQRPQESGHWEFFGDRGDGSEHHLAVVQLQDSEYVPHAGEVTAEDVHNVQRAHPGVFDIEIVWVPDTAEAEGNDQGQGEQNAMATETEASVAATPARSQDALSPSTPNRGTVSNADNDEVLFPGYTRLIASNGRVQYRGNGRYVSRAEAVQNAFTPSQENEDEDA